MTGFKFLLVLRDGEPHDPAVFVTAVPNWRGRRFCSAVASGSASSPIDTNVDDELLERGVNAMFVVEPADG